jgi:hypothetical protein
MDYSVLILTWVQLRESENSFFVDNLENVLAVMIFNQVFAKGGKFG